MRITVGPASCFKSAGIASPSSAAVGAATTTTQPKEFASTAISKVCDGFTVDVLKMSDCMKQFNCQNLLQTTLNNLC